ncbi:Hypothetical protein MVR_LOCUS289 [uncultured virus]|nr:Hypothetical protein MVR_LOCUS289 [uncultured virus]
MERFLQRFGGPARTYHNRSSGTVYTNRQNVHDIHVQKTVCESLQRLLTDPKPRFAIGDVINSGLNKEAIDLLLTYCNDRSIHSRHLLTYSELLGYVWARIVKHRHRGELIKVLGEQVLESEGKCFTGRFNRLVSVLAGFCDDIVIEIADGSRIGAIIITAKKQVTPYSPEAHVELAQTLLLEGGYDADTIKPWLEAIV